MDIKYKKKEERKKYGFVIKKTERNGYWKKKYQFRSTKKVRKKWEKEGKVCILEGKKYRWNHF